MKVFVTPQMNTDTENSVYHFQVFNNLITQDLIITTIS